MIEKMQQIRNAYERKAVEAAEEREDHKDSGDRIMEQDAYARADVYSIIVIDLNMLISDLKIAKAKIDNLL